MIPTEEALAAMAAVECEERDGGDPFGWWGDDELTPEGASRALTAPRGAVQPSGGLREPGAETAPRGAQERRAGNGGAK